MPHQLHIHGHIHNSGYGWGPDSAGSPARLGHVNVERGDDQVSPCASGYATACLLLIGHPCSSYPSSCSLSSCYSVLDSEYALAYPLPTSKSATFDIISSRNQEEEAKVMQAQHRANTVTYATPRDAYGTATKKELAIVATNISHDAPLQDQTASQRTSCDKADVHHYCSHSPEDNNAHEPARS